MIASNAVGDVKNAAISAKFFTCAGMQFESFLCKLSAVSRSQCAPCAKRTELRSEQDIMARKYSTKSQQSVKRAVHEMRHGQLKSGKSGKKVTNPKQAIAIGLSEARKKGAKVPPAKTKAK